MAIEETVLLLFWLIFKSFLSKNTQPDPDFKGVTQKWHFLYKFGHLLCNGMKDWLLEYDIKSRNRTSSFSFEDHAARRWLQGGSLTREVLNRLLLLLTNGLQKAFIYIMLWINKGSLMKEFIRRKKLEHYNYTWLNLWHSENCNNTVGGEYPFPPSNVAQLFLKFIWMLSKSQCH